jgi:uncharacterized membrane protein YcfT
MYVGKFKMNFKMMIILVVILFVAITLVLFLPRVSYHFLKLEGEKNLKIPPSPPPLPPGE